MPPLERLWDHRNRTPVLIASGAVVLAIAAVDWWTKPYVSLGFLYLFPIMLAAAFLPRWVVALLGAACAWLAEVFSSLSESSGIRDSGVGGLRTVRWRTDSQSASEPGISGKIKSARRN